MTMSGMKPKRSGSPGAMEMDDEWQESRKRLARSDKYFGMEPVELARLSHKFEDEGNDLEMVAVQDAVAGLPEGLHRAFRQAYIDMHKTR